jgi:hypothetical protein
VDIRSQAQAPEDTAGCQDADAAGGGTHLGAADPEDSCNGGGTQEARSTPPVSEKAFPQALRKTWRIIRMTVLIIILLTGIILLLAMFHSSGAVRDRSRAGRDSLEVVMLVRPQLPEQIATPRRGT